MSAAAAGPGPYANVQQAIGSWMGRFVLFSCTFTFFLHLCGGIRHLVWDTVHGFELRSIYISGWSVVAASATLTAAAWVAGRCVGGWLDEPPILPLSASARHRTGLGEKRLAALAGATDNGGRAGAADAVVRGVDHCPCRQRLPVFIAWLRTPFAAGGMILLLIALFHHAALGFRW